jgi:hypothetical protein
MRICDSSYPDCCTTPGGSCPSLIIDVGSNAGQLPKLVNKYLTDA